MTNTQSKQVLNLQVTDGITVAVIQNQNHEFLMHLKDLAFGYGVSTETIRSAPSRNQDELIEGKHFVKGVAFCDTVKNVQPQATYWTKQGIIRLGFLIKSERAKLFRNWVESVILNVTAPAVQLPQVTPLCEVSRLRSNNCFKKQSNFQAIRRQ
jgi:hypothetical protein